MLKKMGLVTVGVAAGLMAAAPFASAQSEIDEDDNVTSEGSNVGVDTGNLVGQGNGQGNTVNGVEVPGFPDVPSLPQLPAPSDFFPELPSQFAVPGA